MSIPSETSILSYFNIFITHTNIHLKKLLDHVYHLLQKQISLLLSYYGALVFYLKANYRLNWIWFSWNFFHIHLIYYRFFNGIFNSIPQFYVSCQYFFVFICRNQSQIFISIYFFLVSVYFTNNQVQRVYAVNFCIIRIFHSDISNVINTNVFVRPFVYF